MQPLVKKMAKEFIINDESVLNDRGFRVLTAGIRLEQFEKNPLGLFMHARPSRWDMKKDSILPICQWTNLRKEDGKLYGTPVFDESDEFAMQIMQKVEGGFLRMCSMGLDPITTSSDERYLLPGQKYETVVESQLLEVSIADLASNPNTLALYSKDTEGHYIALSADQTSTVVPLVQLKKNENENNQDMKKIAIKLGLSEDATEDQVIAAIGSLMQKSQDQEAQIKNIELSSINNMVDQAITEKRFTADKKDQMVELGKSIGVEKLRSTIDLMKPVTKPTEHIAQDGPQGGEGQMTFAKLIAGGAKAIETYKSENPEHYATLYKEHYGVAYKPEAE